MNRGIGFALGCRIVRIAVMVTSAILMAVVVASSRIGAQTLADPNPTTKSSGRGATAPSPAPAPERAKACATYGAGFVQMPGSDSCIKIGGFVTIQGGISSGH